MEKANNFLEKARSRANYDREYKLVGIHVRRGDKNWEFHVRLFLKHACVCVCV